MVYRLTSSILLLMSLYGFSLTLKAESMQTELDSVVLGAGCFWGSEKRYQAIDGVVDAISGYADGKGIEPSYNEISQLSNRMNPDNYAEVVKVIFDPNKVTLKTILKNYFEGHDPTQLNRQGNDIGTQYRSIILTTKPEQIAIAQKLLDQYQIQLTQAGYGKIKTKIKPLVKFVMAEDYHQNYLAKNPDGYCPDHSTGVSFAKEDNPLPDNQPLLRGKQIVVVDAPDCPYCALFKKNVISTYKGSIPLHFRRSFQLSGLEIKTKTDATPTILFLDSGKEIYGHRGYLSPEDFYTKLGKFKLGQTEAWQIAFKQGTEGRFCKQYELFKNTADGVFIDKLSGQPLFDTKDRFNSKSGWLSFTKAVAGAVIELPDNSYGMQRTEVRAKISGIHLGHVFDDGPDGERRFCINATVLDFKPR